MALAAAVVVEVAEAVAVVVAEAAAVAAAWEVQAVAWDVVAAEVAEAVLEDLLQAAIQAVGAVLDVGVVVKVWAVEGADVEDAAVAPGEGKEVESNGDSLDGEF